MATARASTGRARRCEVNVLAQPDADLWPPKAWRRRPLSDQALIPDAIGGLVALSANAAPDMLK